MEQSEEEENLVEASFEIEQRRDGERKRPLEREQKRKQKWNKKRKRK